MKPVRIQNTFCRLLSNLHLPHFLAPSKRGVRLKKGPVLNPCGEFINPLPFLPNPPLLLQLTSNTSTCAVVTWYGCTCVPEAGKLCTTKHFPAELLFMQPVWNEAPHNPQETLKLAISFFVANESNRLGFLWGATSGTWASTSMTIRSVGPGTTTAPSRQLSGKLAIGPCGGHGR